METKQEKLTAEQVAKAITDAHGIVAVAARALGVHRVTIERYVDKYPSVSIAKQQAREGIIDLAEGELYKAISRGELAAIFFLLKTIGKNRGYTERQEMTGADGGPVEIIIRDQTD
jgi:hypothetical protein